MAVRHILCLGVGAHQVASSFVGTPSPSTSAVSDYFGAVMPISGVVTQLAGGAAAFLSRRAALGRGRDAPY